MRGCIVKKWEEGCKKVREYYTFKRRNKENKLKELLIFIVSLVIMGVFILGLGEIGRGLFLNNFDKLNITVLGGLVYGISAFLLVLIATIGNKHPGIAQYIAGILMLIILLFYPLELGYKIIFVIIIMIILSPTVWNLWHKLNVWLILMVIIALIFLLIGFHYLQGAYGINKKEISFYPCEGNKKIEEIKMTCASNKQGQLISEYRTTCNLNREFERLNGTVTFELFNGTNLRSSFNRTIEFILPDRIRIIQFYLYAAEKNSTSCMYVTLNEELDFYSQEEAQRRKERFNDYLIALFGIVIFSVPVVITNLMQIWRKGNK